MILETVKKVEGDSPNIRAAFRDLKLILARRGTHRSHYIPNGMIQGWTGTCDTIMHAMMTSYCIRKAKDQGLISHETTGTSLAMIDDAVIVVNFKDDVSQDDVG